MMIKINFKFGERFFISSINPITKKGSELKLYKKSSCKNYTIQIIFKNKNYQI